MSSENNIDTQPFNYSRAVHHNFCGITLVDEGDFIYIMSQNKNLNMGEGRFEKHHIRKIVEILEEIAGIE